MRTAIIALIFAGPATAATLTLPPVTVAGGGSGNCSRVVAGLNDGCAAAVVIAPNKPTLFAGYQTRPPWSVAGVDYGVGVPPGTLKDPQAGGLPTGCTLSGLTMACSQVTTIAGYDFSLHGGMRLTAPTGATVRGNKFALAPNCADPLLTINGTGKVTTVVNNTFDGGGPSCPTLVWGALLSVPGSSVVQYNVFQNVPQDAIGVTGGAGPSSVTMRYNLTYQNGWVGHPDGFQTCGGNFDPIDLSFNTFWSSGTWFTQPMHVEAQCTSTINHATVTHNSVMTPGNCNGGRDWPVGCSANYLIACKQDTPTPPNVLTNFAAFGNYTDARGAIAALTNAYHCPSTTWGSPEPNIDLVTGNVVPTP